MFDTRWRKTLRDAWGHRARTLLVVLAVALGLIGAGAILDAWALVRVTTQASYVASHPVAATLQITPLDGAFLARVRTVPGVAAARLRRTVVVTTQGPGEQKTVVLHALDDVSRPDIGRLQDAQGGWPPKDGEIMIERSSLGYSGATVGAALAVAVAGKPPVTLQVGGLVRDVSVAPGWMDHLVYGFSSPATLARLGVSSAFDELQITVSDPHPTQQAVRQLAWRIKALAEAEGRRVGHLDVPVPGQHIHAAQMSTLMLTQGGFGILTLLVCGCLIVNLVSAMLAGQQRELGIMKAVGASEGQLAVQVLALAGALGLLAVAMALPAAAWLGRRYGSFQGELLNFPVDRYAIPVWAFVAQAAVGVLLPVLAAAVPVARACRQSVMAALHGQDLSDAPTTVSARRWLQGMPLARPQLLSLHNVFRQRQRCMLTLAALATAGAVFVGASNLRAAVERSVDLLFVNQHHDLTLRLLDPQPASRLIETAKAVPGITLAEAWGTARAGVARADGTVGNMFSLLAVPRSSRLLTPAMQNGRWLSDDDADAVVIGSGVLRSEPALQVGQPLQLTIDGRQTTLRIAGIIDSGPEPVAFMSQHGFATSSGRDLTSLLLVSTAARDKDGQLDVIRRLRDAFDRQGMVVSSTQLLSEERQGIEDHLQMVVSFLGGMGWVMIIVGGMGLASTMSVAVLERQREIGVLRAIGARGRTILGMVQLEGLVMAWLGWLLSLPLSVPISMVLARGFAAVMFPVPTSLLPEPAGAWYWLALVSSVSVIACAWPARRALRLSVVRALQYE
ncbi:ABC transporter permease [Dyella amyloliquefaciens]|uniref:ABC transporter permease n=1 Tax=Dyella amyloliquefaciens TaxID=1770545 RepID=UPI0013EE4FDF|nr:ABC transporter permease [Dyella amyloliquefaciens]